MTKGWDTKTLGDVLEKTETVNPLQSPTSTFKYIDVSSVSNATFQIEATQHLKGKDAPSRARKLVRANDILFATIRPTLQRIAIVPEHLDKQVCSTGYFVLRPKPGMDHRFIFYSLFTESFTGQMESLQKGASYPAVTDGDVKRQVIPVPPLPEQQRIVGILDKAFEGIATAKANAGQNLRNARALFEGYLWEVFGPNGKGWPTQKLGAVCEFEGGSQPPKSNFVHAPKTGYVRFLQIRDFGSDKYITFIPESKKNRLCRNDDIMIGRYGASVGKILTGQAGAYNVALIKTIPVARVLDRGFFHHYLMSDAFQERLRNVADRSAQNGFGKDDIQNFPIPLPSLREQQDIVSRLGLIRAKTQRLESTYQQKRDALDGLKKSLLHQAFTGGL
jgi:type I restriction enzyme S subunit